jgi:hypothetical protein
MVQHYLKVAFRNMWKYKSQTLISVVGLAVGFACFAMATLWIRYETSFDSFHKNADRIYRINIPNPYTPSGMMSSCPYPMAEYLRETFPEIKHSTPFSFTRVSSITYKETEYKAELIGVDSSFFSMFDVKVIEGTMDFLIDANKLAITEEKARLIFGNESPLGKEVITDGNRTICAVVTGWSGRSNYSFDVLFMQERHSWNDNQCHVLIELSPDIDMEVFRKKLNEHIVRKNTREIKNITTIPITELYYKELHFMKNVKFQHIVVFAFAGSLLILCTLFNYLTLFISRFRIRQKELALRMVYGASVRSLFTMLSVEFLLSLIAALALGLMIIDIADPYFRSVSEVKLAVSEIYVESIVYIAALIVIALAVFFVTLVIFHRRTLNTNIRRDKKMFRKMSIVVQLTVSIVFAFCTLIILKQIYHLHNTDLGFAFKNRCTIYVPTKFEQVKVLNDKIEQIPEIETVISGYLALLPIMYDVYTVSDWDDKPQDAKTLNLPNNCISEEFVKYYERLVIRHAIEFNPHCATFQG